MIFTDLTAGDAVFVDANTFVYHYAPDPQRGAACRDLLIRIGRQEIAGFTSTHVLSEMAHRLMTIEAMKAYGWSAAGVTRRLLNNPAAVQKLTAFRTAVQEIPRFGVRVLTVAPDLPDAAAAVSQQTGLLSNDALIVAVMRANGLTRLASNDADFDRAPGVTRYAPV